MRSRLSTACITLSSTWCCCRTRAQSEAKDAADESQSAARGESTRRCRSFIACSRTSRWSTSKHAKAVPSATECTSSAASAGMFPWVACRWSSWSRRICMPGSVASLSAVARAPMAFPFMRCMGTSGCVSMPPISNTARVVSKTGAIHLGSRFMRLGELDSGSAAWACGAAGEGGWGLAAGAGATSALSVPCPPAADEGAAVASGFGATSVPPASGGGVCRRATGGSLIAQS
mmetsp:Transcript_216/g.622  ORF Transcript_216/g.622 Transcript_216/m.622 type:complete len:232 (-) Transcript_216:56-751(-)